MQKEALETKFESYFLPFSAQIDEQTTISQSGVISQTILLNSETKITFQEDVMNAIKEIYTKDITINIHALYSTNKARKQRTLVEHIKASYKNNVYPQKNYSQEFYITLSIHGYKLEKQNLGNLLFEKSFTLELEKSAKRLRKIVEDFSENLSAYNPKILRAFELNGEIYSENASFLHKIVYGKDSKVALSSMEISEQIRPISIKRHKKHLTLVHDEEKTHVSCFTIKDFPKADPYQLIKLFTLSHSFVISQTIHNINKDSIRGLFEYQLKMTNVIRDNDIASKCGWQEILDDEHPISMQTNIIVHGKEIDELAKKNHDISACLHEIGLIAVMEDINLEQAFYAAMPSNSAFCNRLEYGTISHAGQFLLSKNMIFEGVKEMKSIPFMPLASVNQKYHTLSPFLNGKAHHILIHGMQSESFTNALNTMLMHIQVNNIVSLDINFSSLGLNKLRGGLYFKSAEVNMLNLLKSDKKNFEMFFTSLSLYYCTENKIPKTEEVLHYIKTFISQVKPEHTFQELLGISNTISPIIAGIVTFAKENHFLSEKDVLLHKSKFISVNTTGIHPTLSGIFSFYILLFNLHRTQKYDIIKLDRTFDVFDPKIIPDHAISYILREYKLKLASVICCANLPLAFEQKHIRRYSDLYLNFDIKFFAEGTCSNYFVKTFFQLNSEITKHLMFVKAGSNKAVIQTLNPSYTIDVKASFSCKELAAINTKHKNFGEIIKLVENNKTSSLVDEYITLI